MKILRILALKSLLIAALFLGAHQRSVATPYASALSTNAGVVSFYLNESADSVKVLFNDGASSTNLGAKAAGKWSFSLGTATSYKIVVTKNSAAGYTQGTFLQTSSDANAFAKFNSPRGVAVNMNPKSPYFGRVYVANSANGTRGKGIYMLNPDMSDAVGQGSGVTNARNASLQWATNTGSSSTPWRLEVGEDDNLYISDFSDATGNIYVTDPNVTNGTPVLVGFGKDGLPADPPVHGTIPSSVIATGSLTKSNLVIFALDGNFSPINGLRAYTIGSDILPSAPLSLLVANPVLQFVNVTCDFDRGPDGKFYLTQNRSVGNEAGLFVIDTQDLDGDGLLDVIWNSLDVTRTTLGSVTNTDILKTTRAVKVTKNGAYLTLIRDDNNVWVLPLTNGVPDFAGRLLITNSPNTTLGRDITVDAAGNVYTASSGQGLIRVLSPGGLTEATTGSDGTFALAKLAPDVFISTSVVNGQGSEAGATPITFSINRSGVLSQPTTVTYSLTGSAENGVDYVTNNLSVTIPTGATNAVVTLVPIDDVIPETTETVRLTIASSTNYNLRTPSSADAVIFDNDAPAVTVAATFGNVWEGSPYLPGTFTITRLGLTNTDLVVNFSTIGTATKGADYTLEGTSVSIPSGQLSATVQFYPLDDALVEGDETVVLKLEAGTGYTVASPSTATITIKDNDYGTEDVLWSDNFDTDSASQWGLKFGANNGIEDYSVSFNYDYSADGLPPAPQTRNGTTRGLKVAVNKTEGSANGSAGVNLYPKGQSFTGNYALRFNMFISVGSGTATTEHSLMGINHSGNLTNRVTQSADTGNTTAGGDGLWFTVEGDASGFIDYGAYVVKTPTALPTAIATRSYNEMKAYFPSPPYFTGDTTAPIGGSPSFSIDATNKGWVDVELSQVGSLITLKINDATVFQYTNTYGFNSGTIMLGHNDQFNSIGPDGDFTLFDNVRVVRLSTTSGVQIVIKSIKAIAGGQAEINFTASGLTGQPVVISTTNLKTAFTADAGAAVQTVSAGVYKATISVTGAQKFYRISN